ncbi:methyltransferase domain-containing protein [Vibrio hannami]|uniref:class I SAM-dependent methyltransferase n=1 Tax=Vibrio hannami TaxID=2717094 RepID=UPI00240FCC22|nr:methyltransferase domain-containing protein [Vibrio hannami]MDG3087801.1 methyltransferase domain-containing protein [Vibrio hannami]
MAKEYQNQMQLKLNIGCGKKPKLGWVNIDLKPSADLTLDAREPLPFSDNSCSAIYSEHFLEHLEYPKQTYFFLKECFRVLEPGGEFSVAVPDTEWPIAEYLGTRNDGYFDIAKKQWHPEWCVTRMEHINQHFREYHDHKFAYDFETLEHVLYKAGFSVVRQREYDPQLDCPVRRTGTLYARASK